jgi:hypothetical protein
MQFLLKFRFTLFILVILYTTKLRSQCAASSPPYSESFTAIASNNSLPACWAASNPGTACLTFSNPLGCAAFASSVSGTGYFYTGGVQLQAGINYSVSVWYKNSAAGSNFSNLSILLGSAQSSTALTGLASTAGAITNTSFSALSATFSAGTSGIYYIAVSGTGATGSVPYLYWDDLALEIPCALNSPTINTSVTNTDVCSGQPVNITASGADTYTWNTGYTGSVLSTTLLALGLNNLYVTGTNSLSGCTSTVGQMINVNPVPNISVVADHASVCQGGVVSFTASGAISYSWSGGGNNPSFTIAPTGTTTYTVTGTNSHNCIGAGTAAIVVNPLPTIIALADRQFVCVGENATLTATGGNSYSWLSSLQFTQTGSQVVVNPGSGESYSVTGTDAKGCASTAIVAITIDACTALTENFKSKTKVYPNPAGDYLIVEASGDKIISLTDLTGRTLVSLNTGEEKVRLDLGSFSKGIYFVKVCDHTSFETIRIVH